MVREIRQEGRKEEVLLLKLHRRFDTFMVYIRLPLEMLFSNSMSAGSVLGVKMVALEEARAKGRTHSAVEGEGEYWINSLHPAALRLATYYSPRKKAGSLATPPTERAPAPSDINTTPLTSPSLPCSLSHFIRRRVCMEP